MLYVQVCTKATNFCWYASHLLQPLDWQQQGNRLLHVFQNLNIVSLTQQYAHLDKLSIAMPQWKLPLSFLWNFTHFTNRVFGWSSSLVLGIKGDESKVFFCGKDGKESKWRLLSNKFTRIWRKLEQTMKRISKLFHAPAMKAFLLVALEFALNLTEANFTIAKVSFLNWLWHLIDSIAVSLFTDPNLTRPTQNLWPLWFSSALWLRAESICWALGEFARPCAFLKFTLNSILYFIF